MGQRSLISFQDFLKVDIRVGKIVEVEDLPGTRNPYYRLKVDFGPEVGIKKSAAQLTHYRKEEMLGRLVLGVVNFPPKQIANFMSEVLILGVPDENQRAILVAPDRDVPLGGRLY